MTTESTKTTEKKAAPKKAEGKATEKKTPNRLSQVLKALKKRPNGATLAQLKELMDVKDIAFNVLNNEFIKKEVHEGSPKVIYSLTAAGRKKADG